MFRIGFSPILATRHQSLVTGRNSGRGDPIDEKILE